MEEGMRYLFLKFTVVFLELAGAVALLAGVGLIALAFQSLEAGSSLHNAQLLLPDGRKLAFNEVPLLRFLAFAPGAGAALLGILMLGVGQLGEAILDVEALLRKGAPPKKG
jgi:hypothetical protein